MHYHLEIIMPPTLNVKDAVASVLKPFSEHEDDADDARNSFWDYWVIGGRYSGSKLRSGVSQERIDAFVDELRKREVTCSSVQFGKQELSPPSQISMVDALWREMCPGAGEVCPLFRHSGEQMNQDICTLEELPPSLSAYRVIVAAPDYEGVLEACYMLCKAIWNGVTHQDTTWDGLVASALTDFNSRLENYSDSYAARCTPKPDWLVVTVDYHS